MSNIKRFITLAAAAVVLTACGNNAKAEPAGEAKAQPATATTPNTPAPMANTDDKYVRLTTTEGDILVRLYGDTPRHQANFIKLVNEGFYNNVLFHRVIDRFMLQTGDPDSREAKPGQHLGAGGPGYDIEAEIVYPHHYHKRGALAAARQGDYVNPERRSSGSQFYIVTGKKLEAGEAQMMQRQYGDKLKTNEFQRLANEQMDNIRNMQMAGDTAGLNRLQRELIDKVEAKYSGANEPKLPQEVVDTYVSKGGTPHLDGTYTVFGEVVEGWDVIDKIEKVQTDANDRPVNDIRIIKAEVVPAPDATATAKSGK